jgi:predicted transcriptional regulator
MRVITFKAEDSLIDSLNTIAIKLRKSRSQIIREALLAYVSQFEGGKKRGYKVKAYELK